MSKAFLLVKVVKKISSNFGMVENTGTGYTGTDIRVSGIRINGYTDYGYTDKWIYGYTDIRIQNFDI